MHNLQHYDYSHYFVKVLCIVITLLNPRCMELKFKLLLFLQLILIIGVTILTYFTCVWLANYLNTVQYKYILHQTSCRIFTILLVIRHVSVKNSMIRYFSFTA